MITYDTRILLLMFILSLVIFKISKVKFKDISFAQQARGIDMSKKEKLLKRIKSSSAILMPLIFSSLERIESISCAMELRAFGKNKNRTLYSAREFKKGDYIAVTFGVLLFIASFTMTIVNKGRFFNPFI